MAFLQCSFWVQYILCLLCTAAVVWLLSHWIVRWYWLLCRL